MILYGPPTRRPEAIISECGFSEADLVPTLRLSRHYTLGELTRVGRSGVPRGTNVGLSAPEIVCNMKQLAVNCLDPIRERFPNMRLNSVWRSEAVNNEVGGSRNSDHLRGFAADIHLSGFDREAHLGQFRKYNECYLLSDSWFWNIGDHPQHGYIYLLIETIIVCNLWL